MNHKQTELFYELANIHHTMGYINIILFLLTNIYCKTKIFCIISKIICIF